MNRVTATFAICLATSAVWAGRSELLQSAKRLNQARKTRVLAEIDLGQMILDAKTELLHEGFAAPVEVGEAENHLNKLFAVKRVIEEYDRFLESVSDSELSAFWPLDFRVVTVLGKKIRVAGSAEFDELTEQIAMSLTKRCGDISSLEAISGYQRALIERLDSANDGSPAMRRELEIAVLRHRIVESQIATGLAFKEHESRVAVASDFELVQRLDDQWDRVIQGTAVDQEADRRRDLAADIHESSAIARQLGIVLDDLKDDNATDPSTSQEIRKLGLEHEYVLAVTSCHQQRDRIETAVLIACGSSQYRTNVGQSLSESSLQDLIHVFDLKANADGALRVARAELAIAQWKREGYRELEKLGYASWNEVAIAKLNVETAKAKVLAEEETLEIARLELMRIRTAVGSATDEDQSTVASNY